MRREKGKESTAMEKIISKVGIFTTRETRRLEEALLGIQFLFDCPNVNHIGIERECMQTKNRGRIVVRLIGDGGEKAKRYAKKP